MRVVRKNAFSFSKISDNALFVDRDKEKRVIEDYIFNKQNVIVIAPRKMGKTWLLTKVAEELKNRESLDNIWIDVSKTIDAGSFASAIVREVFNFQKISLGTESVQTILKALPKIIASHINIQMKVGSFSIGLEVKDKEEYGSIVSEALMFLNTLNKKLFIVFDEFQDITNYDPDFTGPIRYAAQHSDNVSYVFMGSKQTMMRKIFLNKDSIMFNLGAVVTLNRIPEKEIRKLLVKGFTLSNVSVSDKVIDKIVETTDGYPYFTQYFAYQIVQGAGQGKKITAKDVDAALNAIVEGDSYLFETILSRKSKTIKPVLCYIAAHNGSKGIFSNNLPFANNTINYALKMLEEEEILIKEGKQYFIANPFFQVFLKEECR